MSEATPMPEVAPPVWENIPPELATRQQWLLWKFEPPRPGAVKPPKMPYYVTGGRRQGVQGSDKDRARLATLAVVRKAYERGGWSGIGFAFLPDDGLIGIDIDGAIDPASGEVSDRCLEIVRACDSFTEYSPSGKGVHIIVQGQTHINKCDDIGLEIFCSAQFFTFTARRWPNVSPTIRPIDEKVLRRLHATVDAAKAAAKASKSAKPQASPAAPPAQVPASGDDFARINAEAMASLAAWVPQLLPAAKPHGGGYRATSKDLGRNLQEDLSIHPNGIQDFGLERGFTPIDLVMEWLPAAKPKDALSWLAGQLGVALKPARGKPKPPRATSGAPAGGGSGAPPPDDYPPPDGEDPEMPEIPLRLGKGRKPEDCRENVLYCLRHDPAIKGLVAQNLFTELQDKTRSPPWGGEPGEWTEEDDLMLGEYLLRTHGLLIKGTGTLRAGVQMAARECKHHPVIESLRRIQWDGIPRLEWWLVDCLGAADRPYVRMISRFFIMGMVARLLRPGCKFDYMLILQGEQGLGKSTAFKILASPYFMDTPFRIGDKDSYLSLQGVWLVEFSELESLSRAESTAIKAFVSSTEDRFRPPYGSRMVKMPRRAVLAGTTNGDAFLKDSTGDRRNWPVHVTEVRTDLLMACRDQLFAEALHLLESKDAGDAARYYPTREEEKELFQPEQDRWRMVDVWTDILGDYVSKEFVDNAADPNELPPVKRGFFTAQELFGRALQIKAERMDNAKLMQTRVGNAMRELGFAAVREPTGQRKRGYLRPGWEFVPGAGGLRRIQVQSSAPQGQQNEAGGTPPPQAGEGDGLPI